MKFTVIVPKLGREHVAAVLGQIRAAEELTLFHVKESKMLCQKTIGIGVSCIMDCDAFGLEELARNADDALYRSKRNGINRVSCFTP